jgi:peptidoglycan/LPS O-acetylase OafA/YrhL
MAAPVSSPTDIARFEHAPHRQAWVDNLRVAIIVGVIGSHVSLIYALDVGWYYEERTASEVAEAVLAGLFAPGLLFGMGLLFFVAGMFTPPAFARKGSRRFIVDRMWRLGLPVVAYLFIVNPVMNFFGDRAMGIEEGIADYLRNTYWDDVEFGVAWFIAALLLFSFVYAGWRGRYPARAENVGPLRRIDLIWAAAVIVVASFGVRLVWPFLDTGEVLGLNLWEYPQMLVLFALGALAAERGWLADGLSAELRRLCGWAAVLGVVLAALLGVFVTVSEHADLLLGGFSLEATLIPVIEATIAVSVSLWAVDWFRRRWNRAGPLVRSAGAASFAAYLAHAPITVMLAMTLRDVGVPAEVKFIVVFGLAVIASFGLGWLFTPSRLADRIL